MKANFVALLAGLFFALGLGLSGMTNPWKVYAFLDVGGTWDPSLAFVMVGAILVYGLGFPLVKNRPHPVLDEKFHVPESKTLTPALFAGATLFGLGWALA
ncbi:MAG: YeeE/YedE family protein, partial [Proteobacteria bacterium]